MRRDVGKDQGAMSRFRRMETLQEFASVLSPQPFRSRAPRRQLQDLQAGARRPVRMAVTHGLKPARAWAQCGSPERS